LAPSGEHNTCDEPIAMVNQVQRMLLRLPATLDARTSRAVDRRSSTADR
jgi:hypothetical protein